MPDSPLDQLSDGIAGLEAIYGLLLQSSRPSHDHLHLVSAEAMCVLIRIVQERFEDARDGFIRVAS